MCLIEDDDDKAVAGVLLQQELFEGGGDFGCRGLRRDGDFKFAANGQEQVTRAEARVGDDGGAGGRAEPAEQKPTQQRLAGADFAGDEREAFAFLGGVEERGEGLFVVRGFEEEARVRRVVERQMAEAEEIAVHAWLLGGARKRGATARGRPNRAIVSQWATNACALVIGCVRESA